MPDPTDVASPHTSLEPQPLLKDSCIVPSVGKPIRTNETDRRMSNKLDLYQQSNLTLNQLRVWIAQTLLPEVPIYHLPATLNIRGDIDPKHFQQAFQVLINSS